MSKHLGNVLDPFDAVRAARRRRAALVHALRRRSPWSTRRVGHEVLEEVVRKVLLTYWNTASFLVALRQRQRLGAGRVPGAPPGRPAGARPLGALRAARHGRSRSTRRSRTSTRPAAGRRLTQFIDDLSNWYVRRSRRRFWDGDPAALATLHECLEVLTRLMAPFVPVRHRRGAPPAGRRRRPDLPDSVHLRAWPAVDGALVDERLAEQMALVRRLVELGRAARAESGVKTRQPLARALVGASGWDDLPGRAARAGRRRAQRGRRSSPCRPAGSLVDVTVKANFRALGKRFGKAHAAGGGTRSPPPIPSELVAELRAAATAAVFVDGRDGLPHRRRGDRHRDAARGLGGRLRRRRDGRARPRAHAGAAPRRPASATSSGWCRTPARPPGSTSPTGSSCGGRPTTTSWPTALREHAAVLSTEVLAPLVTEDRPAAAAA